MAALGNQYELHIRSGNGVPNFTPSALGMHYVDIATKQVYLSTGTGTASDWGTPLARLLDLESLALGVTKASIGLGLVENLGIATTEDASIGTSNVTYMTPNRTRLLVDMLFRPLLDDHTADVNNPHEVTKTQLGLALVENYAPATQVLAEGGTSNSTYMTPLRTKQLLDLVLGSTITAHIDNRSNPHQVTAAQLGTYTKAEVNVLLGDLVASQYTNAQINAMILALDQDTYSIAEIDSLLFNLQSHTYTKTEIDQLFANFTGGGVVDLTNYYTKPEVDEIPRLIWPVVFVGGDPGYEGYLPAPSVCWERIRDNNGQDSVTTIYALGISRKFPGAIITDSNGNDQLADVSDSLISVDGFSEGPDYVLMKASGEDFEWTKVLSVPIGTTAKIHPLALLDGDNTRRIMAGQTLMYNAYDAQNGDMYLDWTTVADRDWSVRYVDDLVVDIDSIDFHRTEVRLTNPGDVTLKFTVGQITTYPLEVLIVKQAPESLTLAPDNIIGLTEGQTLPIVKDFAMIHATRLGNKSWVLKGDLGVNYLEV